MRIDASIMFIRRFGIVANSFDCVVSTDCLLCRYGGLADFHSILQAFRLVTAYFGLPTGVRVPIDP